MQLDSQFLANAASARVIGPPKVFAGVATDSRASCNDQLFVALKGETFDGHDYVDAAVRAGATGVLVAREVSVPSHVTQIVAADTLTALQQMSRAHRGRFQGRVVVITGSNGKTSTKQMTAAVMVAEFGAARVLSTVGSLNNHIGVPLTLLRLTDTHRVAVIEMGMNHFHELSLLTSLAKPDVAAITNAGPAHLEGVGSLLGVAKAKGEIFEGLSDAGVAVINADDEFAAYWRVIARDRQQLLFGFSPAAHVRGEVLASGRLAISMEGGDAALEVAVSLPGRHNQMNALAVASIAKALNVSAQSVKAGLESATNVEGRLGRFTLANGVIAIDDAYNANPASMKAACAVLEALPSPRILILGDMAELGDDAIALHRELARYVATRPIEHVLTLGPRFGEVTDAFGGKAHHFNDREQLHQALAALCVSSANALATTGESVLAKTPASVLAKAPASVLAKGANSMQMGRAIAHLKQVIGEIA